MRMLAKMKQLNVRSDKAFETAKRLSIRLGETTTAVVERALDRLDRETFTPPTYDELTPEQKAHADRWLALAEAGRSEGDPNASSDHGWLYDEIGAPK